MLTAIVFRLHFMEEWERLQTCLWVLALFERRLSWNGDFGGKTCYGICLAHWLCDLCFILWKPGCIKITN